MTCVDCIWEEGFETSKLRVFFELEISLVKPRDQCKEDSRYGRIIYLDTLVYLLR